MVALREVEVVHSLKLHLREHGLRGSPVSDIVVDADGSYRNSRLARELEPMAPVRIGAYRPDLVCMAQTSRGPLVVAFEVKADLTLWQKGITQARSYRAGVHHAYLALPGEGAAHHRRTLEEDAGEGGLGVLYMEDGGWLERMAPRDPRPIPWELENTAAALRGIPALRHLQLNHPLNYLVVPVLRVLRPELSPFEALAAAWPDLPAEASRAYAVQGAQSLGLLDGGYALTVEGAVAADLLLELGFRPERRIDKRGRLATAEPGIAAVARSVLLRQHAVQLVFETLLVAPGHRLSTVELYWRARERNEVLAGILFLSDPGRDLAPGGSPPPGAFNASTPHKLRQALYHAGIVREGKHRTAGAAATSYRPEQDVWELDPVLAGRVSATCRG
ncbi:MAG: hypothetical protein AB1941_25990 [Gemmatimonadota bacterium]